MVSEDGAPVAAVASVLVGLVVVVLLHGHVVSLDVNYLVGLSLALLLVAPSA